MLELIGLFILSCMIFGIENTIKVVFWGLAALLGALALGTYNLLT